MRNRIAALVTLVVLLSFPLPGCDSDALYPGQKFIPFELSEGFIINIADEDRYFFQCSLTLDVADANTVKELEAKEYRIRPIVDNAVRTRTREQLSDPEEEQRILEEIVEKVNEEFATKAVQRAYFTQHTIVKS